MATLPLLLPVTGTFAPGKSRRSTEIRLQTCLWPVANLSTAFAAYFVLLNLRVSLVRQAANTYIGDEVKSSNTRDANPKPSTPLIEQTQSKELLIASRCHGNFVENVPYALLVASIVEANGASPRFLTGALALLFFFRVAHVEYGIRAKDSLGWGRPVGYFGTLIWIAGMSAYATWLAKPHWGF